MPLQMNRLENEEGFEYTLISECPMCGKVKETHEVMNEREFRKGMEMEPDEFYEDGEEDDKAFYMKQNKVCLSCEGDFDNVFELDEQDEDHYDDVFDIEEDEDEEF